MCVRYRSGRRPAEWLRVTRLVGTAALVASGLAACSFSLSSRDDEGTDESTGSISVRAAPGPARLPADLDQEDLRRANGALALALDPQGNGQPVKWDNPTSRLAGVVVPAGGPFVASDEVCRRFTTTITRPSGDRSDLAGTACKLSADEWHITRISHPAK